MRLRAPACHARLVHPTGAAPLPQYLFKHLGERASELPATCPLHPGLDMFLVHERHKMRKSREQHKCGYCGKVRLQAARPRAQQQRGSSASR